MTKNKNYLPVNKTTFICISCKHQYNTVSVLLPESVENIISCINCNPFYSGSSSRELRMGAVEKFRIRSEKVKK